MHSIREMIKDSPRIAGRLLVLQQEITRMKKETTFATVTLDEISHLIPLAVNSDTDELSAMICQSCGHPPDDHNLENDTCWHVNQSDGTVTLCTCQGWLFDESDQPAAS
jgi:hypothetical protein